MLGYILKIISHMNSKELRENIISHLTKKGNYEPDVDDMTIDKLISNIEIAAKAGNLGILSISFTNRFKDPRREKEILSLS
jgi:hypothetical protein